MKKQRFLSYLAIALQFFSIYVYTPILSTYCESLGASYTLIGTVLSSYGFIQMIIRIPIGIFTDLIGKRKPVMIAGMLFSFFSSLGFFIAEDPSLLILCRTLAGMCGAVWAIFLTAYTSLYSDNEQNRGMGLGNSANSIGQVFATLLGGILAQYIGIKIPFIAGMISAIAGMIIIMMMKEPVIKDRKKITLKRFTGLIKNFDLIFYSIIAVFFMIAIYTGPNGFVTNILKDLHASDLMLGFASTLAMIPSIISSALSGTFFKEKFGIKGSLIFGFIIMALSLLGMGLIRSIFMIIVMLLINGFAKGLLASLLNGMAIANVERDLKSTGASVYQSIYGIGMTLGPIIAGVISDNISMTAAFIFSTVLMLLPIGAIYFKKQTES